MLLWWLVMIMIDEDRLALSGSKRWQVRALESNPPHRMQIRSERGRRRMDEEDKGCGESQGDHGRW